MWKMRLGCLNVKPCRTESQLSNWDWRGMRAWSRAFFVDGHVGHDQQTVNTCWKSCCSEASNICTSMPYHACSPTGIFFSQIGSRQSYICARHGALWLTLSILVSPPHHSLKPIWMSKTSLTERSAQVSFASGLPWEFRRAHPTLANRKCKCISAGALTGAVHASFQAHDLEWSF